MTKKIVSEIFRHSAEFHFEDSFRPHVMAWRDEDVFGEPTKKGWEINWPALGNTSVEETEDFIKLMKRAVSFCKRKNKKLGIK